MFTCEICGMQFKREKTYNLHKIREEIKAEGYKLLSLDEIRQEVALRRGGVDVKENEAVLS